MRRLIDWLAFRTTKRYNVIKLHSLEPNYWDKDTILLHAVMQLVVDFVEVECAFMEQDAPYTFWQWVNLKLPWFLRSDEAFRNRELGLRHLDMLEKFYEDKVKGPSKSPKVIKEVYLWWRDVRPARVEPDKATGWHEYCEKLTEDGNRPDWNKDKKLKALIDKTFKLEQKYLDEDTEMLKKVIEHRGFMWT